MPGERVVFTEESDPERYVKLIAAGEIDETLLDALTDYVKRQRKRLGVASQRPDQPPTPRGPSVIDDEQIYAAPDPVAGGAQHRA